MKICGPMTLTFLDALSLSIAYHGKLAHITGIGTMRLIHGIHMLNDASDRRPPDVANSILPTPNAPKHR
jgi:hypothetical protein